MIQSGKTWFPDSLGPLLVPIEQVRQHDFNPNNGDLEKLTESVRVNGFLTAVTADVNTGQILAGNHRFQVLHAMNATHIPVIWVDKTASEGSRFLLGDNATGQAARLDEHQALDLLKELQQTELGIAGSGFTEQDYLDLINQINVADHAPLGGGFEQSASGICQVVVEFDNPADRDMLFMELHGRFGDEHVRTVNL